MNGIEAASRGSGSASPGELVFSADRFSSRKACIMLFASEFRRSTRGSPARSLCGGRVLQGGGSCPAFTLMEDRIVLRPLWVTSNAETGAGSLRVIIATAPSGSTIRFANSVHNITLTSGPLLVSNSVTIDGPGANEVVRQRQPLQPRLPAVVGGRSDAGLTAGLVECSSRRRGRLESRGGWPRIWSRSGSFSHGLPPGSLPVWAIIFPH